MLPWITVPAPVATLALTGAVLVAATGGAVAGSLITGAQVQNGSLTGKDVKDGSLKTADLAAKTRTALTGPPGAPGTPGAPGVSGLQLVASFDDISNNAQGNLQVTCPTGKSLLSATAFWAVDRRPVKVDVSPDLKSAFAVYHNTSGDEAALTIEAVCASVAG